MRAGQGDPQGAIGTRVASAHPAGSNGCHRSPLAGNDRGKMSMQRRNFMAGLGTLGLGAWSAQAGMMGAKGLSCHEPEKIKLFDGKTLDGWVGHEKYWSVVDGVIVGKNTEPVAVSTYLLTKRSFRDFRLTATVKLVQSEMHSGISLWGRVAPEKGDPYTYAGHLVMFPSGWGMYDLYGRNGLPVDPKPGIKVGKQHDWNDLEILALGDRIRVVANGVLIVDWREPEPARIRTGPIGLQLHSNTVPQEVHFRDLELEVQPEDRLTTIKAS